MLLSPWSFPGKNTRAGLYFLLQGSSQSRDQTHCSCISCIGRQSFYHCAAWEAPCGGYICPLYADTVTGQQVWRCQKESKHTTACFVAEHFEAAVSPGTTSPSVPMSSCTRGAHRRVPTEEKSAAPPGPDLFLSLT